MLHYLFGISLTSGYEDVSVVLDTNFSPLFGVYTVNEKKRLIITVYFVFLLHTNYAALFIGTQILNQ